jgi:hypothetical protein
VTPAGAGTVPATVTVPAGQISASFTFVDAAPSGTVTVTSTFNGTTSTALIAVQTGGTHLVINEVDYDMPSTDTAEFIECSTGATRRSARRQAAPRQRRERPRMTINHRFHPRAGLSPRG